MTKKKSKFLTFCCSLIPGAGEMYLGFLKQGISIMSAFFLLFAIAGILFPPSISFCAVVWFYSFFHTHNLNNMPDDEFYAIQDDFLIHIYQIAAIKRILLERYRIATAIVLILLGLSIIWNNMHNFFMYIASDVLNISWGFLKVFTWFSHLLPRSIAALLIIAFGIYLIRNKRKELDL